jgi:hypothetical protein
MTDTDTRTVRVDDLRRVRDLLMRIEPRASEQDDPVYKAVVVVQHNNWTSVMQMLNAWLDVPAEKPGYLGLSVSCSKCGTMWNGSQHATCPKCFPIAPPAPAGRSCPCCDRVYVGDKCPKCNAVPAERVVPVQRSGPCAVEYCPQTPTGTCFPEYCPGYKPASPPVPAEKPTLHSWRPAPVLVRCSQCYDGPCC